MYSTSNCDGAYLLNIRSVLRLVRLNLILFLELLIIYDFSREIDKLVDRFQR